MGRGERREPQRPTHQGALLGIAVKLPADLNTAMPGRWDQLSKLTGAVLVCTAMGNIMPSLGVTDEESRVWSPGSIGGGSGRPGARR